MQKHILRHHPPYPCQHRRARRNLVSGSSQRSFQRKTSPPNTAGNLCFTDFGAEVPFHKIPDKLTEHYGISVPVSSSREITERHAAKIVTSEEIETDIPEKQGVDVLIKGMCYIETVVLHKVYTEQDAKRD
jgi:hypothetical protein